MVGRLGERWRQLLRPAGVEDLPAEQLRIAPEGPIPDRVTVRKVLQLCLRVGDLLLEAGMSANDVVVVLLEITHAYGLARVHIDVTYTAITISSYPDSDPEPMTVLRIVQPGLPDYGKAEQVSALGDRIALGLPIDQATAAFEQIRTAPSRHPWWLTMAGNGALCAGVALLFTTSWRVVLLSFLVACLADRLIVALDAKRVPPFVQQALSAALITVVAVTTSWMGNRGVPGLADLDPTLVVVGGIVMLVAGMLVVAAMQDALDQFYVTAGARLLEVLMRTAGIVAGLLIGLSLTKSLGIEAFVSPDPVALGPVPAQLIGAFTMALAWAVFCHASPPVWTLAGVMGVLGWVIYLLMAGTGAGEIFSNAVGAFVTSLVATLFVRRTNLPGFALIAAALLPLVPGLALYNGMFQLVGTITVPANPELGFTTLGLAFAVALGIGAGASFGVYLGRPLVSRVRWLHGQSRRRPSRPSGE